MTIKSRFPVWQLIFPQECLVCNSKTEMKTTFLCTSCSEQLQYEGEPVYQNEDSAKKDKNDCFSYDFVQAVFPLTQPLRILIHNFKYNEMTQVGKYLAKCAVDFLAENSFPDSIDYVCPIPLHPVKKRMRGFNQAEVLSREITKRTGLKHVSNLVVRKKFTQTQTKLKRDERQKNVSDAFAINRKWDVEKKVVLIVDDVFTTGSTANSICVVLKKNGAKRVFVLTIAKA